MQKATSEERKWKEIIRSENNLFSLNLKEIWNYRDLLMILVRRDILAIYKQTILGPLWFFLQPVLSTIFYILIFSRAAKISTDGIPPELFYLSGLAIWGYFAECITRTSTFLKDNTAILSKVYFPRLILPLSLITTNLVKFTIQLGLFFLVYIYFLFFRKDLDIHSTQYGLLLPFLILMTGLLGFGMGLIVSSLTIRYKDLVHLIGFGVQLLMFASSVVLPLSIFPQKFQTLMKLNPMTGIIEAFRYGFLGKGYFRWELLAYDTGCVLIITITGIIIFNFIEKSFVDTI